MRGESTLCAIQLWIFRVATGSLTPGREDFSIINWRGNWSVTESN